MVGMVSFYSSAVSPVPLVVGYLVGVCKFGYSKRLEGLNFRPPRNNPNVLVHGPPSQPWRFSNGHVDVRRISSTYIIRI